MKVSICVRAFSLVLLLAPSTLWAQATKQTVDVVGQAQDPPPAGGCVNTADRPVVSEGGGTLIRTRNGINIGVHLPTPVPGSYCYPPANPFQTVPPVPGTPEVFTGWAFIFNYPANCTPAPGGDPNVPVCDGDDIGPTAAMGGVYNFAGHAVSGGGHLNLAGHVSVGETPFGGSPLMTPAGAEVHAAVAPHGVLVPDLLPDQIKTPVGMPPFWWLAVFVAP